MAGLCVEELVAQAFRVVVELALVLFYLVEESLQLSLRGLELALEVGSLLAASVRVPPHFQEFSTEVGESGLHDGELRIAPAESFLERSQPLVFRGGLFAKNEELAREGRAPRVPSRLIQLLADELKLLLELVHSFRRDLALGGPLPRRSRKGGIFVDLRQDRGRLRVEELGEPRLDGSLGGFHRIRARRRRRGPFLADGRLDR